MRKFVVLVLVFFLNNNITFAVNLNEALTKGYSNDEQMLTIRRNFLEEIEAFPQALAAFLPSIIASIDSSNIATKGQSQFPNPRNEYKTLNKNITLDQPVFNGGGSVAGLKAAQSQFRASRGSFYSKEQEIILNQTKAFLDFYANKEKHEISSTSVRMNQEQLNAIEAKLRVGEATITDLAAAKSALENARTKQANAYANLQASKANFTRLFGLETDELEVPKIPESMPNSLEELIQKSAIANPAVQSVKNSLEASKSNEYVSKTALMPTVNFRVQAGRVYYDPEVRNTNNVNSVSVTSTLSVQVPILNKGGAEYSRVRIAKNKTRLAAIGLDAQIKKNKADCITNWEAFNATKISITAANQAVEAAQIAYEGYVQEENVGTKTILDVLNAEAQLSDVKSRRIDAITSHIIAAYQIKALTGELTARSLKLKVDYFIPEKEFKRVKLKIIGS